MLALLLTLFIGQDRPASKAQAVVSQLAQGDYAAVEAQFTDKMKAALPVDRLAETWKAVIAQAGAFKQQLGVDEQSAGGFQITLVHCEFERARADIQVVVDQEGHVAGLFVRPAAAAVAASPLPPYAIASAYSAEEITVGSRQWPLPATLTLPTGTGPFPGVVLVHGSGPNDRDETVGANKPFRDLAVGLASRGIAVLRYEKRTKVFGAKLASIPNLTVKEETIDDVVLAVEALRKQPKIDPSRVFVLGHSLGGMLVPRIGAADSKIAGLIVMAGAVRPLEQAILDQTRYLAMLDGTISPEEQDAIAQAQKLVDEVRALTPADAKHRRLISGAPASYWLDLRGYDPPAAASRLTQPLLILQGERDYQVTMDEFARWKEALGQRPDVELRSYPALNHLFISGTGRSLPSEYSVPGYVDEAVIRDIAAWITRRGASPPQSR